MSSANLLPRETGRFVGKSISCAAAQFSAETPSRSQWPTPGLEAQPQTATIDAATARTALLFNDMGSSFRRIATLGVEAGGQGDVFLDSHIVVASPVGEGRVVQQVMLICLRVGAKAIRAHLRELCRGVVENVPEADCCLGHRHGSRIELLANARLAFDIDDDSIATHDHVEAGLLPNVRLIIQPHARQLAVSVLLPLPTDGIGAILSWAKGGGVLVQALLVVFILGWRRMSANDGDLGAGVRVGVEVAPTVDSLVSRSACDDGQAIPAKCIGGVSAILVHEAGARKRSGLGRVTDVRVADRVRAAQRQILVTTWSFVALPFVGDVQVLVCFGR